MRKDLTLLVVLSACDTPVTTERLEAPSSAPSIAERGAVSSVAMPGHVKKLVLTSGATVVLPAQAEKAEAPSSLPDQVTRTHMFKLGADARLMVNELSPPPGGCPKALDDEWTKMKKAQGDSDEERLKYRRMAEVAELEIGGRRTLYSASNHAAPDEQKQAALATMMWCSDTDYVVIMYALKQPSLPGDTKAILTAIAQSYAKR